MTQTKFLTNNATLHIKANGDVLIKRRRLLNGAGIFVGLLLVLGGLSILVNTYATFGLGGLLFGTALVFIGYFLLRAAWDGLREPDILIAKSAQRISLKPRLMGGVVRHWYLAELTGVAIWRSDQLQLGSSSTNGDVLIKRRGLLNGVRMFAGLLLALGDFGFLADAEDVYQAGVVLSGGMPMSLVEVPAGKRERVAEILTEATGLGTVQLKQ